MRIRVRSGHHYVDGNCLFAVNILVAAHEVGDLTGIARYFVERFALRVHAVVFECVSREPAVRLFDNDVIHSHRVSFCRSEMFLAASRHDIESRERTE